MDHRDYAPWKPLAELPYTDGFRFLGIGHKSETIPCSIWKGHIIIEATDEVFPSPAVLLKGWRKLPWWQRFFG